MKKLLTFILIALAFYSEAQPIQADPNIYVGEDNTYADYWELKAQSDRLDIDATGMASPVIRLVDYVGPKLIYINASGDLVMINDGSASQFLQTNGSGTYSWATVDLSGYLSNSLTSANIFVGSAGNVATGVAVTGDIGLTNAGVASISSGVIVNGDVNASAAIAGTKISPDFGSQNITTTGSLTAGAITGTSTLINGRFNVIGGAWYDAGGGVGNNAGMATGGGQRLLPVDGTGTTENATVSLGSSSFRYNEYWGTEANFTGSLTAGAISGTTGTFSGDVTGSNLAISNWNTAYNDKINSAAFNTGDGILTLTQQDAGTVTADLDGRYLTSYTETSTLDDVTDRGSTTTNTITVGNQILSSAAGERIKVIGGSTGDANTSWVGFYESNGTTPQGYVGFTTGGNDDIYLESAVSGVRMSNSNGYARLNDDGTFTLSAYTTAGILTNAATTGAVSSSIGTANQIPRTNSGATGIEWIDPEDLVSGANGFTYQKVTLTIASADVLTLSTTPISVISAPGAGKVIVVDRAVVTLDYNSATYTTGGSLKVQYATSNAQIVTFGSFLNDATTDSMMSNSAGVVQGNYFNDGVELTTDTTNPLTGNSPIKITIFYWIGEI